MNDIVNNSKSAGSTKLLAGKWRGFRNRLKRWWMQWPYCDFREDDIDRYHRTEHWRQYQIRRSDVADILTRR